MKFFICCFSYIISLSAQPEIPELKQWANDFTNTLSAGQLDNLNYRLKTYEDSTSNQLIALMISSLLDYPIEYYAIETAEKNKIGTKEHDNGVLFLVVKDDRKVRIEVGYGLEGTVPDALASSIIRNVMIPHFKNNDYYTGITDGILAVISAIAGEYKAEPDEDSEEKKLPGIFPFIFILIFIFTFLFRRGGGRRRDGFVFFPRGFGGSSGGGSWGGFGGGGFSGGGFSGGGGSFGGGGASGSW